MQILSNILAFLFVVGVIIFVHELGHLLVAKAFGVRVLTFSLGFGRRIWGFKRAGTDYRVSVVPLGGYVSFAGQDPAEAQGQPGDYLSKPRWQRVLILLAGPLMNVVLAVALVAIVFMLGTDMVNQKDLSTEIGAVPDGSPAFTAGLRAGDRILSLDREEVTDWQQVSMMMLTSPERPVEVTYERQGQVFDTIVTPAKIPKYELGDAGLWPAGAPGVAGVVEDSPAAGAGFAYGDILRSVDGRPISTIEEFIGAVRPLAGQEAEIVVERAGEAIALRVVPQDVEGRGQIGIYPGLFHFQRHPPVEALVRAVRYNIDTTVQIFTFVGKIFERRISAASAVGGPIEIAVFSGAAARSGFKDLLLLMALISLNLFLLNMLPIPILDGGQIGILLIEGTLRRDLSLQLKERMIQVGLVVIVMLMAMALYFDLVKNLPNGDDRGGAEAVEEQP